MKDGKKKKWPNFKKKVMHETFGEGTLLPELHEDNTYDVMFKHGVEQNVAANELTGLEFIAEEDMTSEQLAEWSLFGFGKYKPTEKNAKEKGLDKATDIYAAHLKSGDTKAAVEHYKNIAIKYGKDYANDMHKTASDRVVREKVADKKAQFSKHAEHYAAKEGAKWEDKAKHNSAIKSHYDAVSAVHGKDVADDMSKYAKAKHEHATMMAKHGLSESLQEEILDEADMDLSRHFKTHAQAKTEMGHHEEGLRRAKERLEMTFDHVTKKFGDDAARDMKEHSEICHKCNMMGYEHPNEDPAIKVERAKLNVKKANILKKHDISTMASNVY